MKKIIFLFTLSILATSCTSLSSSIRNPTNYIEFIKSDFNYTEQVSSTSKVDFFLGFPMSNTRKSGSFSKGTVSLIGSSFSKLKKAESLAIYKLIKENPGYDVVLYPKFDTKFSGFIITTAEVSVTARLAKLKK